MKLRDKLWLWGQTEGSHHINDAFKLPGKSRMTPLEGAYYFGIRNMCRVVMMGLPKLPFDQDQMVLDTMENVVWSIIGDGTSGKADYTDEIIRLTHQYPNITGVIMDDIMRLPRMEIFSPESYRVFKEKLKDAARPMPLWCTIYTHQLTEERIPYIAECDVLTLWTWHQEDLPAIRENLAKLRALSGDQPIYGGLYMWDYGNKKEISDDLMQLQMDTYYELLKNKEIAGVIVCSNCCADVGLKASDMVRDWIRLHGDEEIE